MKKLIPYLFYLGALLTLVGVALQVTRWQYAPYLVTIGATLQALAQLNSPYTGDNKNIKRLVRQQFLATILLIAAGGSMLYFHNNEWILLVCIAAFLYLYSSFRIPQEEKKDQN